MRVDFQERLLRKTDGARRSTSRIEQRETARDSLPRINVEESLKSTRCNSVKDSKIIEINSQLLHDPYFSALKIDRVT